MLLHRDLRELGSLVEGSMVIPRQSMNKPIPYKYVIHRGGSSKDSVDYEFIYEESKKKGEHVNRSLLVDSALLGTGGGKPSRGLSGQPSSWVSGSCAWHCLPSPSGLGLTQPFTV